MKFLNFTLVIIFFICTAESCSNKNKVEPQNPTPSNLSNASRKNDYNIDISYDNSGNPVLIKQISSYWNYEMKVNYEGEKIKDISLENKGSGNNFTITNYTIKYISENEVYISRPDSKESTLIFNEKGLLEKAIKIYDTNWGKEQYITDYTYNSDNLVRKQTTGPNGSKDQFEMYDNYDQMNNPFFAKAKIWSIINEIYLVHIRTYIPFPISRNNPKILTLRDYDAGNKLVYKYDKNNFPIEIQEYFYKGVRPQKESDYFLMEDNIKLSY